MAEWLASFYARSKDILSSISLGLFMHGTLLRELKVV